MTLSLFKPKNHPQQIEKRGVVDSVDERFTPADLYREFDSRFHFTLDAAASLENAKCSLFYDRETDGLRSPWAGHRVWCNPPYSDIEPWLKKAHAEHPNCPAIVLLLPANRTEQPFWHRWIEPLRDKAGSGVRTEFIACRRNFGAPHLEGKWRSSPPFGLVAIIFEAA